MTRSSKECIAIDSTSIKEGGENGGLKIAVLNYLKALRQLHRFRFVLVGTPAGRSDLLPLLAHDDLYLETWFPVIGSPVMVRDFTGAITTTIWRPGFLQRLGVTLLYSPFGTIHFSEQGLPFVTWIADLLHRDCPITLSPYQIQAREDGLTIAMRESLYVQTNSQFVARRIQKAYGVSQDRMVVIPPIAQELQRPEGLISAETPYFFYPANFWAHKNHRALLSAYKKYLDRVADPSTGWSLVMTGHPGPEQEQVKQFAKELGVTVRFLGYLDRTEYVQWFARAGCLLFPSLYEGFGMPLVEAMRLRVPIAAAEAACIPEICGNAMLKFDPTDIPAMADAMLSITVDESLRRDLVTAGEERQKIFDSSLLINELAEVFSRGARSEKTNPPIGRSFESNVLRVKLLAQRYLRRATTRRVANGNN